MVTCDYCGREHAPEQHSCPHCGWINNAKESAAVEVRCGMFALCHTLRTVIRDATGLVTTAECYGLDSEAEDLRLLADAVAATLNQVKPDQNPGESES